MIWSTNFSIVEALPHVRKVCPTWFPNASFLYIRAYLWHQKEKQAKLEQQNFQKHMHAQ